MTLPMWILAGIGVYLLYCAAKGINPVAYLAEKLGIQHKAPTRLGGTP